MQERTFVNFTNHESGKWTEKQIAAAEDYGVIVDLPFPSVMPDYDEDKIAELACEYSEKILELNPAAVLCQGEFNLCYSVINRLRDAGVTVVAATSKRETVETGDTKVSKFTFGRFREYR